jgi:hypothetical protein
MDSSTAHDAELRLAASYPAAALTALLTDFGAGWEITKRPDGGLIAVPRLPGSQEPVTAATPYAMRVLLSEGNAKRRPGPAGGSGG